MAAATEQEVEDLVAFLKVLADRNRVRILGLLSEREYTVKEMASVLGVTDPTVSSHLNMLKWRGLVTKREQGTSHFYSLRQEGIHTLLKDLTDKARETGEEDPNSTEFEKRVLRTFFIKNRLTEIPAKRSRQLVILKRLVQEFQYGEFYDELQVNAILKRFHDDCATLRRQLIDNKFMTRKDGQYWRLQLSSETIGQNIGTD